MVTELTQRNIWKATVRRTLPTNRLFVYGIFLNEGNRIHYGMTNPCYGTVPGYITVGHHIVEAYRVDDPRIALTGLTVDVNPKDWDRIDVLEGGYDRNVVVTDTGEEVYMYTAKEEA